MDDLIRTHEAAALLGITPKTLRTWVAADTVRVAIYTAGGQARFRRSDILEMQARLTPSRSA